MTGSANDFVAQIAEAYSALQKLPELQAEITRLKDKEASNEHTINDLNERIFDKEQTISSINERNRSLEVERDQAQFQVLELEERLGNIARVLSGLNSDLSGIADLATVTKPQPEIPAPVVETAAPFASTPSQSEDSASASASPSVTSSPSTESHGDGPFATSTLGYAHDTAPTPNAEPSAPAIGPTDPKPYFGKAYWEVSHYVSFPSWIAGGGTEYGYYANEYNTDRSRL